MYLPISLSIVCRLTSTLRWVCTMPRGSAVVPEVKTIWKGVCTVDRIADSEQRLRRQPLRNPASSISRIAGSVLLKGTDSSVP